MNMQIISIILYNIKGEKRTIKFNTGKVNIITGNSKTGKSALIYIVGYCLGSTFKIPDGIIRDVVEWYAILIQIGDTQVFIAKPKPEDKKETQSRVYYEVGSHVEPPHISKLVPNSNDDAINEYISHLIGISPNLNKPSEGQTRKSLEATLNHTKFYLFQKQNEIANPDILFHKQSEEFISQSIKDTLPYFLGAIQEDRLRLVGELRNARRKKKIEEKKLYEAELIVNNKVSLGQNLINEAKQAGLVDPSFASEDNKEIIDKLKSALKWQPSNMPPERNELYLSLYSELGDLRNRLNNIKYQISEAEDFANEAKGYLNEAFEQKRRLESINLLNLEDDGDVCPLCASKVPQLITKVSSIKRSLTNLNDNILSVNVEQPRLREYIQKLEDEYTDCLLKINEKKESISDIVAESKSARASRDNNVIISRTIGRISLYLDTYTVVDEQSILKTNVLETDKLVKYLESQLDSDEIEELKTSALSLINSQMTEWAKTLDLESKGYPYRIDLNRLTVVIDKDGRPSYMKRGIGGGEDWLGCHLIALFALHKYFIEYHRPVPNFIILDQPSQVYFPSEKYIDTTSDVETYEDKDIKAVNRVFGFIFDICEELSPNLQVIITEHANLGTVEFQNNIIERWTGDNALIPKEWYS